MLLLLFVVVINYLLMVVCCYYLLFDAPLRAHRTQAWISIQQQFAQSRKISNGRLFCLDAKKTPRNQLQNAPERRRQRHDFVVLFFR